MLKPATVTQAELASVVTAYTAVEKTVLDIRRRIAAGASIEAGALECFSRPDPLQFIETQYNCLFGLEVAPAESPLRAHNMARRKKAGHA